MWEPRRWRRRGRWVIEVRCRSRPSPACFAGEFGGDRVGDLGGVGSGGEAGSRATGAACGDFVTEGAVVVTGDRVAGGVGDQARGAEGVGD